MVNWVTKIVYGDSHQITSFREAEYLFTKAQFLPIMFADFSKEESKAALEDMKEASKKYSDINPMWIDDPEISKQLEIDPETWP